MRRLALTVTLFANSMILAGCLRWSPLAAPAGSAQQPTATLVADLAVTSTPIPDSATRAATPPSTTPLGLSRSRPASLYTTVEHPHMTITLVGLDLPAGFPVVTPDPGHRFVAPQLSFFCQLPADSYCRGIGSFELIDAQGTRHSPVIAVTGEGFLSTEDFPGGTSITGGMVFMVPVEATPFILRYVGDQDREAFFRID